MNTANATSVAAYGMYRHFSKAVITYALSVSRDRKDCKRKDRDRAGNSYHGPNVMKQVYFTAFQR